MSQQGLKTVEAVQGSRLPQLHLPTDHTRTAVSTGEQGNVMVQLTSELHEQLESIAVANLASVSEVLFAAFTLQAHRYSGQNEFHLHVQNEAGQTLVVPAHVDSKTTFASLLQMVREAMEEEVAERAEENVNPSVLFVMEGAAATAGLHTEFALQVSTGDEGLNLNVRYDNGLFEQATVERFLGHLQVLIAGVAEDTERSVLEYELLTAAEREQLLVEWNAGSLDVEAKTLVQLFEAQAAHAPEQVAVVFEEQSLTYEELNARANQLAHALQARGVQAGARVGLMVERSIEMVVGLLGILKAGGAYIPLDPAYPKQRLAHMLEDAQPAALVTEQMWSDRVLESIPAVVYLDGDRDQLASMSKASVEVGAGLDDVAYIIYTSGSTGKPKGVQIPHRAVSNFLQAVKQRPGMTANDTLLAVTSISFDISVLEIFLPLTVGARLVLASRETALDGGKLAAQLDRHAVTMMQATPVTWRMLLDSGWENGGQVKMLCGGEALSAELAEKLIAHGATLFNMYGPTETTIWSSTFEVNAETVGKIAIGRPLPNQQMYVLDELQQPVPVGVAGELYIGGAGLSVGYVNRDDLTAEKFVPHPFSDDPNARLYRTGDSVRYLPDGNIQYLSRVDNQIKLRGFRIELGEIQAVLEQHAGIKSAVVDLRADAFGNKRLVAYLIADQAEPISNAALHAFLKNQLPDYMIPSSYQFLDAFPLTPNGKIDRKALPEVTNTRPELSVEYQAPSNEIEETITGLWSELFGIDQIGIRDDFFELGGHSLLATQMISRIRETFQVESPLNLIFRNPTVAGLAKALQEHEQAGGEQQIMPIVPVSRDIELPLSFSQERVWFVEQLNPGKLAYIFSGTLRIRGPLLVDVLRDSLSEILVRHEIFRTSFSSVDGRPYQVIHEAEPAYMPILDLEPLPEHEREAAMQAHIHDIIREPMDLTKLPMVKWVLYRFDAEHHLLLHIEHHLVHDGWSFRTFMRDALEIYRARKNGEEPQLPELTVQFADFAHWQREFAETDEVKRQLDFWVKRLEGASGVLELPFDRPRPPVQTLNGSALRVNIPAPLLRKVRALCRKEGVTLFMVLMAAYQTMTHRYSGQKDMIVASGIANRRWKETEPQLGMLVNNVAFRTDFTKHVTFRDVLLHVRDNALDAYDNQDVPFDRVVDALNIPRDMSRNPLYQVMFSFHDTRLAEIDLPELDIELIEVLSNGSAKFDFNIICIPHSEIPRVLRDGKDPDGATLLWEYNTDLFNKDTIERMTQNYLLMLEGIVADPTQDILAIPMLTEQDKHKIVYEWNDTAVAFPEQAKLHELFEEQVLRTPDNIAVIDGDRTLTYAQLNERANQLAHHLRTLGVAADVPVGICMERSVEMIVGLYGILKAGGAYVPIDTDAPIARKRQVLADAKSPVCLSMQALEAGLPTDVATFVYLDRHADEIAKQSTENLVVADLLPEHLVSIYYTSGSTGTPKGVSSTHYGWVNRMCWMQDHYQMNANESILQKTTLTFDDAAVEVFWPLMVGARIAILEPGLHKDPRAILEAAIKHQVAVLQFVPSMLQLFLEAITAEESEKLGCLRHVISSGEALRSELVKLFIEKLDATLYNQWGATEVSIDSTVHACSAADAEDGAIVSIGKPIANNQVYVLDSRMEPTPIGIAGDLYLAGVGLARGYLNNPERTAEAFVDNPFVPGAKMYSTGDRGYFRPDGSLVFLGRLDDQVKIRGQRVELAEIEAVLAMHPAVKNTAVIARKGAQGYRLYAYYVLRDDVAEDVLATGVSESLRAFMAERLPEYMVPGRFIGMDEFPFTTSGKIDRKQLPEPGDERPELAETYVAPRTATEATIAQIWQEVMGLNQVGVYDKFFDLGGHSLDATRVVSRTNRELGVKLPLRALFDELTVAGLAKRAEQMQQESAAATSSVEEESIPRLGTQEVYELSPAQKRLYFQYQFDKQAAFGATYVDVLEGELDETAFAKAVQEMTARHGIMRTTFGEREGTPVQIVTEGQQALYSFEDLTSLPEAEREPHFVKALQAENELPFDFAAGPLFRWKLFKMAANQHLLVRSVHPIAYDSWSTAVLMRDLSDLYAAAKAGTSANLSTPLQYVDYAAWLNKRLNNGGMDEQRNFWQQQLAAKFERDELPVDADAVEGDTVPVITKGISAELTAKLRELSNAHGATLYWTMLAGFKMWMARVSGQTDITVCSPLSGRTHPELEQVLGLLVNPVIVRTDLSANPSGLQVLERVKQSALGVYANQDYPFDLILQEARALHGADVKLYSVVFVGQNAHKGAQEFAGGLSFRRHHAVEDWLGTAANGDGQAQSQEAQEKDNALHIEVFEEGDVISLRVQYDAAKFKEETVLQFLSQYEFVLEQFAANPFLRLTKFEVSQDDALDELF